MKYRLKKREVVQAMQFTAGLSVPTQRVSLYSPNGVETKELQVLRKGDWLVIDSKGKQLIMDSTTFYGRYVPGPQPYAYEECSGDRYEAMRATEVISCTGGCCVAAKGDYIVSGPTGKIEILGPSTFESLYVPA